MHLWRFLLLAWLAAGLARAGAVEADASIQAFVQTYFSSWSQADFAKYRGCFHPEATIDLKADDGWRRWDTAQFFAAQEAIQNKMHSQEVPLGIHVQQQRGDIAMVEVPWKLLRGGGEKAVTGYDWYTLVKGGPAGWRILHLTFWEDPAAGGAAADTAPAKRQIVVSGFAPAPGVTTSASAELAKALAAEFPQFELKYLALSPQPGAASKAIAAHRASRPTAWLAIGEGSGSSFRIETQAINQRTESHTAAAEIVPGGPPKLLATGATAELCARWKQAGLVCTVAEQPADDLANELLYGLFQEQQSAGSSLENVLLIRVPPYGASLSLNGRKGPFIASEMPAVARALFAALQETWHLTPAHP